MECSAFVHGFGVEFGTNPVRGGQILAPKPNYFPTLVFISQYMVILINDLRGPDPCGALSAAVYHRFPKIRFRRSKSPLNSLRQAASGHPCHTLTFSVLRKRR